MTHANQSSKKQTSQQPPLVSIYWDYQNAKLSPSQAKSLLHLAQSKGRVISTNVYYNSQINYSEAIEYLTEAIKTALNQGKPTTFDRIDKLMRQRCANYQGCSSISTPDGKKFNRFDQFIDVAVKDGKVRKQNQELFLIELDILAA